MQGGRRDDVPDRDASLLPLSVTWADVHDPLSAADRVGVGRALVFLLQWQTAVQLGRRPERADLADPVLLTAFRMSTPAEEVRGEPFLVGAAALLDHRLIDAHREELSAQLGFSS